jgi:hypothetical protein
MKTFFRFLFWWLTLLPRAEARQREQQRPAPRGLWEVDPPWKRRPHRPRPLWEPHPWNRER